VANGAYNEYDMDEYPQGANAIVAVISYTGFDMEDAMIINKSSYERGFGHASLYKYKKVDLREERVKGETIHERFRNIIDGNSLTLHIPITCTLLIPWRCNNAVNGWMMQWVHVSYQTIDKKSASRGKEKKNNQKKLHERSLDDDGLPYVGQRLVKDNPYYVTHNDVTDRYSSHKFKEGEPAVIDEVRVLDLSKENEVQTVGLKLRINRNPIIGDKFSSRHGQKGVLSVLWPQENMPFTESGMSPDVIINPHVPHHIISYRNVSRSVIKCVAAALLHRW
jgi:DNA-directed RNA polymerase I subunit RPA2